METGAFRYYSEDHRDHPVLPRRAWEDHVMSASHALSGVQFQRHHEYDPEEGISTGSVHAVHQGKTIGSLEYSGSTVDVLHVDPQYRGQKLSGRLYEHAYDAIGEPIRHQASISESGRGAALAHARTHPHMHAWE